MRIDQFPDNAISAIECTEQNSDEIPTRIASSISDNMLVMNTVYVYIFIKFTIDFDWSIKSQYLKASRNSPTVSQLCTNTYACKKFLFLFSFNRIQREIN